jgi:hypothetical protein
MSFVGLAQNGTFKVATILTMVKFTVRFKEAMYEKIKSYSKHEGITFMAALRQIINQFFKERK